MRPQSSPGAEGLGLVGVEAEAGHEDVTRQHPERVAQQRQGLGDPASRFQRAAVVAPFVAVGDAQAPATAIAQCGLELVFQIGRVDHDVAHAIACQGLQVPGDQRLAADRQQGLGRGVGQRAHALAAPAARIRAESWGMDVDCGPSRVTSAFALDWSHTLQFACHSVSVGVAC